jgi:hypothetical protein
MLAATQGVTCLGGDPTTLPGTWGSHNFLQVYNAGSYSRGYLPGRRSHRSTRSMGQPQLSSGIEGWQLLKGLPAWEEIPQIYPVHGAATTFFRYRMLAHCDKRYLKRSSPLENCSSANGKKPCWCGNILSLPHAGI